MSDNATHRILLCTVGGSHQPLVTAIRDARPDYVVFFCTDRDPGTNRPGSRTHIDGKGLCIKAQPEDEKPSLPNIPAQCSLDASRHELRIVPADDLDANCKAIAQAIREMRARFPGARILADYTGGTKTMSAALVFEALNAERAVLQLVTGNRADLVKVRDGAQMATPAPMDTVRVKRAMAPLLGAWARFAYDEAAAGLEAIPKPADRRLCSLIFRARDVSAALAAWDRFDHAVAQRLLQDYAPALAQRLQPHFRALTILTRGEEPRRTGLRIWDLWLNARRRAAAGRYDDAVARLYRMLEWTAQWVLARSAGIDTADVPTEVARGMVPPLQPNREGKYQAGLYAAWRLVAANASGPARAFSDGHLSALLDQLKTRNDSILAHGFEPVTVGAWNRMSAWFESAFVPVLIKELELVGEREPFPQLPDMFELWD